MTVTTECVPVIFPCHLVFGKPAVAFEHAFRQDDIHFLHRMTHAPNVDDFFCTVLAKKILEIHLVQHSLNIGHANLKRSMNVFPAVGLINRLGVFLRDDSLSVKFCHGKGLAFLYAFVFAHALCSAVLFYGDHISCSLKLVVWYHDHAVRSVNIHTVDPHTARKHQSVIGVQFGKLTHTDFHIKHNTLSDRDIKILSDKRQLCMAAHIAGTLKGEIAVRTGSKIQRNSFGTEHGLRFFLTFRISFLFGVAVKDFGKVHVEKNVRKIGDQILLGRHLKIIAVQYAHGLKEQCVIFLFVQSGIHSAFFRGGAVERNRIYAVVSFFRIT